MIIQCQYQTTFYHSYLGITTAVILNIQRQEFLLNNPKTKRNIIKTLNEANEHLLDFHNGNILFKDNQLWTISKNKYTFICKTHGEFQATFQDVVRISAGIKAKGCSVCAKESRLVHLNHPVDNYLEKIS